ncbi:MAG: rhamnogalacturonan acetylesterase, partial [Clostridia bacterium]|nr:rhamnogalacturonan acetylesterase [Clostridia bacterium]
MKFKKAIHLMLSAVMLSSFLGSFNVEADNSLFSAKYDFGAGKVCDGYTQIKADDKFDQTKGYGFSSVDGLSNGGSDVPDELKGDYVTSSSGEINFEVAVPDGDYEVKMLNGGDTATEVNIYINDGERVRVFTINANEYKENIQRVIPKDGKITFKFKGKDIKVNSIEITQLANRTEKGEKPTIYIAGDSTAQTYKDTDYPQAGWGQTVGRYFTNDVIVENRSIGGRSTKSYNNDGRLDNILTSIKPGDYIFIQFGHNDGSTKPERYISVEDFKTLLTEKYIGETVKRGAIPVLLTPTTRCEYDKTTGLFAETLADYSNAIREVAAKTGTVLIDINNDSRNLWNKLGFDVVKTYYFICEKGESVKYPEGTDDRTHFKKAGADAISKLVVKGVRSSIPALVSYTYDPDDMPAKDFSDMTGHWAKDTVAYMSKTGIVEGISDTEFAP